MMNAQSSYGWQLWVLLIISVGGLGLGLSPLDVKPTTVLWLILSAILIIGGGAVRVLLSGIEEIVKILVQIRDHTSN